MDIEKYRKWYLEDRNNLFTMVKFGVEFKELRIWKNNRIVVLNFGRNHPFVLADFNPANRTTHFKLLKK